MRVAVWRYGMAFQTEAQSTVGGGLLSSATVRCLVEAGHTVDVVGPVAKGADLKNLGAQARLTNRLTGYEAAVILTGPYNPLYGDASFDTYRKLASFEGKVVYAQWDVALPFHFGAMESTKASNLAGVRTEQVFKNKAWHIASQSSEADLRAQGSKSVAYQGAPWAHVPCLFELEELLRTPLPVRRDPFPSVGYLGSDRPGRMAELTRWFAKEGAPSVHLYGRWTDASLRKLTEAMGLRTSLEYRGKVPEEMVRKVLNAYAATMYMTDPAYVKTDFIAQRFFENVSAGVPVLYSDKIQPSVRACIPKEWVCSSMEEFAAGFKAILQMTPKQREARVREHAAVVRLFAAKRKDTLAAALARSLT